MGVRTKHSELFVNPNISEKSKPIKLKLGCDYCVIPENYENAHFHIDEHGKKKCNFCMSHKEQTFLGKEKLIQQLNLKKDEKVGIMVSGGKDSIYAWMWLCDNLGSNRVVAFNQNKVGLVHPYAMENIANASDILNSKVYIVDDTEILPRFKKNIESFLEYPDPAMVRVALCAGCRYGITKGLYKLGEKKGITKYVSAASYLELAPFKSNLMKNKGKGNEKYGLIVGLAENNKYNFDDNISIILRDDDLAYKDKDKFNSSMSDLNKYELFDFDNYFPNNPEFYENSVTNRLNWKRPEKSWHFDCVIESFKDFFYYGLLGYTETDFKICQMIRYNLLSREEGIFQMKTYHSIMKNSLNDILNMLEDMNLIDLEKKIVDFFSKSEYYSN